MTVNWPGLTTLSDGDLQVALLAELELNIGGMTADEEDTVLAALAPPLRVLWLLDWLDFEVAQGSLSAYLGNSHGRHAFAAAEALDDIGATSMASIVRRAARLHAQSCAVAEQDMSEPAWPVLGQPPHAAALADLTDEFHTAAEQDQWGDKLDAYLRAETVALASTE